MHGIPGVGGEQLRRVHVRDAEVERRHRLAQHEHDHGEPGPA